MAGKKKESKGSEKKPKELRAAKHGEIMAMNFEDFKKSYLKSLDAIDEALVYVINWDGDQHDVIAKTLAKEIRGMKRKSEKYFGIVGKRLHELEAFVAFMAITTKESLQRKPLSFAERESIASCVSIKWGKKEEKAYNAHIH